ncbi:MAG: PD-(D/E)XK nuclease family protein [Verrucomicrobiales bacterium]|nr:PD-(D/E)XK nuclease family protein [Verrucomicrobiales bacterium]
MNCTLTPPDTLSKRSDDPLQYISASRLKCWQECSLKWYFRYIEQIPTVTSPALLVGKVVHEVLQFWNLSRWRGRDSSVKRMQQVFEACWAQLCEESDMHWEPLEKEGKEKTKAWSILEFYFQNTPIPEDEKPEAVEVRVERDLDAHGLPPLLGIIDLVRDGGRIVDFKTTAQTPKHSMVRHTNEIQMGIYGLLYREATGHTESGFEIHSMVKTKQPKLVITTMEPLFPDQTRKLVRLMESYVRGVVAEEFLPSPGMHCQWCDYFRQCRAWKGGSS